MMKKKQKKTIREKERHIRDGRNTQALDTTHTHTHTNMGSDERQQQVEIEEDEKYEYKDKELRAQMTDSRKEDRW